MYQSVMVKFNLFSPIMMNLQLSVFALYIESIISGLIDHAHLRQSEKKLSTIVTQESHYFSDHDSINVTFKNF